MSEQIRRKRIVAAALAIPFGGLGLHKFYLGRIAQGFLHILFCWTAIPSIIGFIEGIMYLAMTDETFAERYGGVQSGTHKEPKGTREEISILRNDMVKLKERVNFLEYSLSAGKGRLIREEKEEAKKVEERRKEEVKKPEVQPQQPVFKEEIPQEAITPARREKGRPESFEQIVGGRWFNKLGILAVVIGVALLIGYSFKYFGPVGKILIGYSFGLGFLLFGNHIEKKEGFSVYGKTLIGGGWAIIYFTTFAMHHIPAVRLVKNPFLGMLLLLGASIASVIHIYKYRSEVATAFSYLLMFITLMISPISPYTMSAGALVAISLIFFMYKMRWVKFGLYGMGMTYLTYMWWVGTAQQTGTATQRFFVAMSFLFLYWVIFAIATFLIKKDDEKISSPQEDNLVKLEFGTKEATHVINGLAASCLAWFVISSGFMQYLLPVLGVATGLYLFLTLMSHRMRQRPMYIISSTFAIIFAAIFLSTRYTGYSLTVLYIILAQLILLSGIIFKESYWRVFSVIFLLVILGKLIFLDGFAEKSTGLIYHINTRTLLFTFAFIVYLISYILYEKLKKTKMIAPFERNYPTIMSYTYPAIYAIGTWLDLPKVLTAPCWIILGIILLQMGISKDNKHQRLQGYILSIGAFIRLLMSNMTIQGSISIFSYRLLTSLPVLLLLYYGSLLLKDKETEKVLGDSEKKMAVFFPYMVFIGIMFLVRYEVPTHLVSPAWGIVAIAYSLIAISLKRNYYLSISSIAALSAGIRAIFVNILQERYLVGAESVIIYPILTIVALYAGNVFYLIAKESLKEIEKTGDGRIKTLLHSPRLIFGLSATTVLTILLIVRLSGVMLTIGLGIEGLLLFACGFQWKERQWRISGLILLLLTLLKAFVIDLRQLSTLYYILSLIVLGVTLLFISYIYTKHKDKIKKLI